MSTAANPQAPKPSDEQQEPTGAIASDSLAAESIKADGGFADNENAAISSVKGANSTLNNTDTSGASVLQPATDGTERARQEAKGLGSDEKGTTGLKYPDAEQAQFDGVHSAEGYVGGPSDSAATGSGDVAGQFSGATGDSFAEGATATSTGSGSTDKKISSGTAAATGTTSATTSGSSSGGAQKSSTSSDSTAEDAPNYAATVSGALRPEGEDQPKGENLTEGGIPQTKTFTGAVGGPNDPGRLAEQEFTKVGSGSVAAAGQKQHDVSADGPKFTGGAFDTLESERA